MKRPKTINSLMSNMRNKGIQINGSSQKRKLRYIGYFHGYKGYRYHGKPSNLFNYTSFNELQAVYDFDVALKTIFYPRIMFIETALKNFALEEILLAANSSRFADIYATLLTDYKSFPIGTLDYKKAINRRMGLRNKIYSIISRDYGKRFIVNHYYDNDRPLPIWAIFELLSFGEFGTLLSCLELNTRLKISRSVGISVAFDRDGKLLPSIVFALKDLRNAVAHNNTVFDTRFHTASINKRIGRYISSETGVNNITFNSIVDYVILISIIMHLLKCPRNDISALIRQFEQACDGFRKKVSVNIYSSIIYTDTNNKLKLLKKYI